MARLLGPYDIVTCRCGWQCRIGQIYDHHARSCTIFTDPVKRLAIKKKSVEHEKLYRKTVEGKIAKKVQSFLLQWKKEHPIPSICDKMRDSTLTSHNFWFSGVSLRVRNPFYLDDVSIIRM